MDFGKFTHKAQEAILGAQNISLRYHHQQIEPLHLLLSLLEQPEGMTPRILSLADINPEGLKKKVEVELGKKPQVYAKEGTQEQIYMSPAVVRSVEKARGEAEAFKDDYVSVREW